MFYRRGLAPNRQYLRGLPVFAFDFLKGVSSQKYSYHRSPFSRKEFATMTFSSFLPCADEAVFHEVTRVDWASTTWPSAGHWWCREKKTDACPVPGCTLSSLSPSSSHNEKRQLDTLLDLQKTWCKGQILESSEGPLTPMVGLARKPLGHLAGGCCPCWDRSGHAACLCWGWLLSPSWLAFPCHRWSHPWLPHW